MTVTQSPLEQASKIYSPFTPAEAKRLRQFFRQMYSHTEPTSFPTIRQLLTAVTPHGEIKETALGRSLTATVHRLSELRNEVGAGHGTAAVPDVDAAHARLAAAAGASVAEFLLSSVAAG